MSSRAESIGAALDRFITAERLRLYPMAILIGQVVMVTLIIAIPLLIAVENQTLFPDFAAPWTGASFFLDGRLNELYDVRAQWAFQQVEVGNDAPSWFVSPPHVALIYAPLAFLPFRVAGLIWTLISITCIIASIWLMKPFAPRLFSEYRTATILTLASVYPIFELLGAGQQSAVTLFLMVAGIRLALGNYQALAGIVFALGAIKPQLFILVPIVLIAMRMWKALAAGTLTGIATLALTHAVFGPDVVRAWFEALTSPLYADLVQVDQAWKMVGIPAFLVTLVPPSWASAVASTGTMLTIAIVVVASVRIFVLTRRQVDAHAVWTFALIATVLASPHLVVYDFVLILVPTLWLVENANTRATRVTLLLLYFLSWTTAIRHMIGLQLIWPLTLIDASWATLAVVYLWREFERALRKN